MGTIAYPEPETPDQEGQAPASAILVELVRLLARHAAREAFATAQSALTSGSAHCDPENPHEAQI